MGKSVLVVEEHEFSVKLLRDLFVAHGMATLRTSGGPQAIRLAREHRPILFIHGSEDPIIPVEHAHRLIAASRNPADELWILKGFRHTEGVRMQAEGCEEPEVSPMRETYLKRVTAFFDHSLR